MKSIRIAVLSTEGEGLGGAVRATRRLVKGLELRGHEVRLISLLPHRTPTGIGIAPSPPEKPAERLALTANAALQWAYIAPRRTSLSNTHFSAPIAGYSFLHSGLLEEFDIVNIHWTAGFLAPHTVAEMVRHGRPVVFTLHDMASFTGGCHYSAGCRQYRESCARCPQLTSDALGLTEWTLAQKRRLLPTDQISAVAPSRWLSACAAESGVFQPERVFTIANAIDTDLFRPTDKPAARALLGIEPGIKTLMFGAENNREHRKGFDLLLGVWQKIRRDARLAALLDARRIRILVIGTGNEELRSAGVPLVPFGSVRNDARLALIYSAADLLILPSREDNQPNILLEAMSSGTPVVAFAVGGIPEVIEDAADGRLVPPFDLDAMASAVTDLLTCEDKVLALGTAARRKMTDGYRLDVQAAAYEELFRKTLPREWETRAAAPGPGNIALPVTLAPGIDEHPIGVFLEQQAQIDTLRRRYGKAQHDIHRVRDVVETATRELLASRSWRYTRSFRGTPADPGPGDPATAEQAAVVLLNLFRSRSWKITAPLRLLSQAISLIRRRFPRLWPEPETGAIECPTLSFFHSRLPPQRLENPVGTAERDLNVICLHLYHLDLWEDFRTALIPLIGPDTPLYVTLPEKNDHFISSLRRDFDERCCKTYIVENRGLDIYPFLFLFHELSAHGRKPLTLTKLHTKKSIHHTPEFAATWRRELCEGLMHHHRAITRQFHNPALGMVCSRKWWVQEDETSENFQTERRVIEAACKLFGVAPTGHYLTGSMYVVSFDYLQKLFTGVDWEKLCLQFPTGYRQSGTLAHGFERAICYGLEKFDLDVGLL